VLVNRLQSGVVMVIQNVGSRDRIARAVAGGALALAELSGYLGPIELLLQMAALGMALFLVTTGLMGFCPTYTLLGIRTCAFPESEDEES